MYETRIHLEVISSLYRFIVSTTNLPLSILSLPQHSCIMLFPCIGGRESKRGYEWEGCTRKEHCRRLGQTRSIPQKNWKHSLRNLGRKLSLCNTAQWSEVIVKMLLFTINVGINCSTTAKIAALEAKLLQMDKDQVTTNSSCSGGRQRKPRRLPTSYYSPEHVRRKHGSNIKIQRPQKQGSKGENSLKRL